MKRIRVIPVLLLAGGGLVKTVRFKSPRYLGDPINAVRIFSDKQADELILLDTEATARGAIDFGWVEDIVSEAFMPVAYGGGIRTIDDCARLLKSGVEKVVINTAGVERPGLIADVVDRFGAQSVVAAIDAGKDVWRRDRVFVRSGTRNTGVDPAAAAASAEAHGAGEIMVTSIAREGTFTGYDAALIALVASRVRVPVIANGGAASLADFVDAVSRTGCSAVAASSMFVFAAKGEGVLITYPTQDELMREFWTRVA